VHNHPQTETSVGIKNAGRVSPGGNKDQAATLRSFHGTKTRHKSESLEVLQEDTHREGEIISRTLRLSGKPTQHAKPS
jgi:hypothetical protein